MWIYLKKSRPRLIQNRYPENRQAFLCRILLIIHIGTLPAQKGYFDAISDHPYAYSDHIQTNICEILSSYGFDRLRALRQIMITNCRDLATNDTSNENNGFGIVHTDWSLKKGYSTFKVKIK